MGIPLEDNVEDILAKATRGLKLAPSEVAERAGIAPEAMRALLAGTFNEADVRKVAPVLGLGPESLVALGKKSWYPEELPPIDGLIAYNTPYGDMFVNAFLVWDPATKEAAAFDTGSDCAPALAVAREKGLNVTHVFLTHTHPDHIADLARLTAETGAPAYVSHLEPTGSARAVREGDTWRLGHLTVGETAEIGQLEGRALVLGQGGEGRGEPSAAGLVGRRLDDHELGTVLDVHRRSRALHAGASLGPTDLVDRAPVGEHGQIGAQGASGEVDPVGELPQVGEDVLGDVGGQVVVAGDPARDSVDCRGIGVVDVPERELVAGVDPGHQHRVGAASGRHGRDATPESGRLYADPVMFMRSLLLRCRSEVSAPIR